jgi:two-component sensor histidine kinase
VDTRRAVPIGLIMNECITNALKYAFSDGHPGTIRIVAGETQDGMFLEVSDDGVGMPPDFDPERSPGMGLQLVRMLADQLKGVFIWKTNGGSMFRVQIPAA